MSTYVCSDLHGEYDLFVKLLKEISFTLEDEMYIIGDIIDKGTNSLKLLDFIMQHQNIHCVMGNHEQAFMDYCYSVTQNNPDATDDEILNKFQLYFPYDNFKLTWEIYEYIESLPYYIETKKFICVHAGFETDANGDILPLEYQSTKFMVYDRSFKDKNIKNTFGKPILIGHTPCYYDNPDRTIIKSPNINSTNILDYTKIRLDTGAPFTHLLGCLRIEDMKEFYITK